MHSVLLILLEIPTFDSNIVSMQILICSPVSFCFEVQKESQRSYSCKSCSHGARQTIRRSLLDIKYLDYLMEKTQNLLVSFSASSFPGKEHTHSCRLMLNLKTVKHAPHTCKLYACFYCVFESQSKMKDAQNLKAAFIFHEFHKLLLKKL